MTEKEAIKKIEAVVKYAAQRGIHLTPNERTAFDMAISALKDRPKGEWLIIDDCENFTAKCSVCGRIEDSRMVNKYPFCHCGADMRAESEVKPNE